MGRAKAGKGEPLRVLACGECAAVLWAQGKAEATVRLEQLRGRDGRDLQRRYFVRISADRISG